MNARTWIVLLAFLGWSIISWYWYVCKIKHQCGNVAVTEQPIEPVKTPEPVVEYGPLTYNWKGTNALTTDAFPGFIDGHLKRGADGQLLVISGPYYSDETAPSGFENMGLARAAQVRDLIQGKLATDRIELTSHNLGTRDAKNTRFGETRFKWVTRNDNVQETMDGALIYFPYNSDEKISNPNIESYLDKLANNLKENGGTVQIVGHTDDKGSEEFNLGLGQKRSTAIKQVLVAKGVNASAIRATSKGESDPIASNSTEDGNQKNRRTEIIIGK